MTTAAAALIGGTAGEGAWANAVDAKSTTTTPPRPWTMRFISCPRESPAKAGHYVLSRWNLEQACAVFPRDLPEHVRRRELLQSVSVARAMQRPVAPPSAVGARAVAAEHQLVLMPHEKFRRKLGIAR